jgi:NHL repeat
MHAMVIFSALLLIAGAGPTMTTAAGTGRPGGDGDGGPPTSARLDRPHGVAVGADGSFWIGDTNNHRVRLVSPER